MEITDRVAIVTGGASGIGRALCIALARAGAAGVVVADIDGQGHGRGHRRTHRRGPPGDRGVADLSQEAGIQALTSQVPAEFGRIDLVCSNAGIIVAGGVELPDDIWSKMWAVNVHSHVALARAVLPGDAGQARGLLRLHRLGRRAADPAWLRALCGDEARSGRVG